MNWNIRARLEWKLEDFWVGAFWRKSPQSPLVDIWICLLPCVPLHITLYKVRCPNCGAWVKKLGKASDGNEFCCIHCCFNPGGCRCKHGEYGVAEDKPHYELCDDELY